MICCHCSKEVKNARSKQQHEIRCKKNPTAIKVVPSYGMLGKKGTNQFAYGAVVSDNTKKKLSESSKRVNESRWSDPANRLKQSLAMKRAVEEHPESYTSANRGRTKQIIVDGIKLQGQWEVDFYNWAIAQGLSPSRPNIGFAYEWNGSRTYFPDFYINSLDLYVEVKGYETERDRAKWSQFPKKLCIIKAAEIKKIRQGCFDGL
jgi:hypothetical protein